MTTKQFLRALRKDEVETRALVGQIERLEREKALLAAHSPLRQKLAALQALCRDRLEALQDLRKQALEATLTIDDSDLRTLLLLYYFDGQSVPEIARALGYSESQVWRLHRSAVRAFEDACKKIAEG